MLINIYIPPTVKNSNRNKALNSLYQAISEQQTAHPAGFLITAGDLSHADLKVLLPKLPQHVDFPTRGDNSLYLLYTTWKGACEAFKAGDTAGLELLERGPEPNCPVESGKQNDSSPRKYLVTSATSRDTQSLVWHPNPHTLQTSCHTADQPQQLFWVFDSSNNTKKTTPPPDEWTMCLAPASMMNTLPRINPCKTAGLDNIPGCVLKDCA